MPNFEDCLGRIFYSAKQVVTPTGFKRSFFKFSRVLCNESSTVNVCWLLYLKNSENSFIDIPKIIIKCVEYEQ